MIKNSNSIVGHISSKNSLSGKLSNGIIKIYPVLENLNIVPSAEPQTFTHPNSDGYDRVMVTPINSGELNVSPTMQRQEFEGLYHKVNVNGVIAPPLIVTPSANTQNIEGVYKNVTVAGDSDLKAENIKQGVEIFGVTGSLSGGEDYEINNGYYLFTNRESLIDIWLPKCKKLTTCHRMFSGCNFRTSLDLSKLDTSSVTNMSYMFSAMSGLKTLDLTNFNTSNVRDMSYMFNGCYNLNPIDVSNFNTSNAVSMFNMFDNCNTVTSLDLTNFDTSNVTSMASMFSNCALLTDLDLSSFDASKVTNIRYSFMSDINLTNLKFMNNLGKDFTSKTTGYSSYQVDLHHAKLTHESLMDVINKLYDLNLTYNVANGGTLYKQKLILGSTLLAKLTEEEKQIATDKGWILS